MKISIYIVSLFSFFNSCSSSGPDGTGGGTPLPTTPTTPTKPLTDTEAMDQVQKDAIKYFWEYADSNSKLARERYITEDPNFESNIVTTGGSAFGLMSIIVGVERGFLPRAEAVSRLTTALTFLEKADRFHGAWPHWMDNKAGKVIPFGTKDNGGDLVETSFVCQALITIREYFKNGSTAEKELATKADELWKGVEWDWYTQGQDALYWHWSPNYGWEMNFKLEGYNECLITYVMAASSPTHPISAEAYHKAWARNGAIIDGRSQYGIPVVLNYNGASGNVGPMFWSHYSYLGLDPNNLKDKYADYWQLTQNHAKIMVQYSIANPKGFKDYSDKCWGLTASYTRNPDGTTGYTAHQPNNDNGVISPTAALSSFPYTPIESMKFLHYLYDENKAKYVGIAGPYDAFSPQYNWVTARYLAIDQGTIAPMIENYRTGLLWKLFMNASDTKQGLKKLGFTSGKYGI
ncbi:beta-glucosidase [Flavobacterium sp. WLB]|uniref:glucoamylase family protein n=1 Tax=unclassified Flavobacterium TaxID=196869 RepID=UPI0006AB97E6|nr:MULTISPECIES: glucoamylase family protein [unclassified Flavobacterium]KOP36470.1 beta-glucosidase [Flavobacterium sp. VMW]OWU90580.1 beta-glucosidase [Flavobacterium sp. NLM]PUU70388.1 beta-glucosidase [Flavobacterium sp. WLB]